MRLPRPLIILLLVVVLQWFPEGLLRERPPRVAYDVIVCRNVVIYFDRPTQERLFAQFAEALAPGGCLVLGMVETLFGPARAQLALVDARERIYRRAS